MARILSEQSESSFSASHAFCGCTTFWRDTAFDVRGAKQIRQDALGELVFKVGEAEIRWHKPVVYQGKEGMRQEIAAHYVITDKNRVGFELANIYP